MILIGIVVDRLTKENPDNAALKAHLAKLEDSYSKRVELMSELAFSAKIAKYCSASGRTQVTL